MLPLGMARTEEKAEELGLGIGSGGKHSRKCIGVHAVLRTEDIDHTHSGLSGLAVLRGIRQQVRR